MDKEKKRCGNRKDGNQEQKPTDTLYFMFGEYSEKSVLRAQIRQVAETWRMFFEEYVRAGFSEPQAIFLIAEQIKAAQTGGTKSREEDDIEQMEYIQRWTTHTRKRQAEILAVRKSMEGKGALKRIRGAFRILQIRHKYWRQWHRE